MAAEAQALREELGPGKLLSGGTTCLTLGFICCYAIDCAMYVIVCYLLVLTLLREGTVD